MLCVIFFSGKPLLNIMNGCLHPHPYVFFSLFQGQLSAVGYSQVFALVSKILTLHVCVLMHACV